MSIAPGLIHAEVQICRVRKPRGGRVARECLITTIDPGSGSWQATLYRTETDPVTEDSRIITTSWTDADEVIPRRVMAIVKDVTRGALDLAAGVGFEPSPTRPLLDQMTQEAEEDGSAATIVHMVHTRGPRTGEPISPEQGNE